MLRVSCVTSLLMARRSLARSAGISATAWNWTCAWQTAGRRRRCGDDGRVRWVVGAGRHGQCGRCSAAGSHTAADRSSRRCLPRPAPRRTMGCRELMASCTSLVQRLMTSALSRARWIAPASTAPATTLLLSTTACARGQAAAALGAGPPHSRPPRASSIGSHAAAPSRKQTTLCAASRCCPLLTAVPPPSLGRAPA